MPLTNHDLVAANRMLPHLISSYAGTKGKKRALPGRDKAPGSPQRALADATNSPGLRAFDDSSIGRSPPPKRHSLEGGEA